MGVTKLHPSTSQCAHEEGSEGGEGERGEGEGVTNISGLDGGDNDGDGRGGSDDLRLYPHRRGNGDGQGDNADPPITVGLDGDAPFHPWLDVQADSPQGGRRPGGAA